MFSSLRLAQISLCVAQSLMSASAFADPIIDNAFAGRKVGWFPSNQTSCKAICAQQNATAEFETFNGPTWNNSLTFVCKGTAGVANPWGGQGWLYGNNFNSPAREKVCVVSTAAGSAQRLLQFYCLCVI